MFIDKWVIGTAFAASTVSATLFGSVMVDRNHFSMMKRGNLSAGSPLYNCHENCGMAIEEIQNCGNVCNDTTFITDYDSCLQCAGSDNEDIWKYYGPSLNTTAASCGFSTTPESGTQDSVGAATTASNSTAACEAAQSANSSASASSTASSASSTASSPSDAVPTAASSFATYGAAILVGVYALVL